MANQNQAAFDEGVFTFDGKTFGVTDLSIGEETSEIDVSDTETASGESEFIYGKSSRPISFTAFHKVGEGSLPTKEQKAFTFSIYDEHGSQDVLSGQCTLGTKTMTGSRDGAVTWAYTGKIQGAINESLSQ